MADLSDDPADVLAYWRKLEEGYDCAFGSRFLNGSTLVEYPRGKRAVNRAVNRVLGWMFRTELNDLTNAFKAYRSAVVEKCGPLRANGFDVSVELSLGALAQGCAIAQVPIGWRGRTAGRSKLSLISAGPSFLRTVGRAWARRARGSAAQDPRRVSSASTISRRIFSRS
jgi:dolichol-phosphate mannosyltransferase